MLACFFISGIICSDSSKINELLEKLNINIENDRFYLDEKDVSEEIRKTDVAENVSKTAAIKEVREKILKYSKRNFDMEMDFVELLK